MRKHMRRLNGRKPTVLEKILGGVQIWEFTEEDFDHVRGKTRQQLVDELTERGRKLACEESPTQKEAFESFTETKQKHQKKKIKEATRRIKKQ